MSDELFIDAYENILNRSLKMLKEDRFAAIVVGDVRDAKGIYKNFVSKTIEIFQKSDLLLYNELILLQEPATAAMRAFNYMNSSRKIAKCHQNVLVFVKGDPKNATNRLEKFTE